MCAGLCPTSALRMRTNKDGDPEPLFDGRCLPKCDICLSVCPFTAGLYDPRMPDRALPADAKTHFHENIGWHRACYVGHVASEVRRRRSASGGLATWLLQTLLQRSLVDKVAVVQFVPGSDDALFRFVATDDPEEVGLSTGSVYYPVGMAEVVRQVTTERKCRWAIIGVPCLCSAVRSSAKLRERVPYLLGLVCGMYQNRMYTEFLLAKSGLKIADVKKLDYREKLTEKPVSNFTFRAHDGKDRPGKPVPYKGAPYWLGRHAHFRLNCCNYCTDVFAETADVTFADAWLPGVADRQGTSLVIVRSPSVYELLEDGRMDGSIVLQNIDSSDAARTQAGQIRRKQELIPLRHIGAPGGGTQKLVAIDDRLDWWLQRVAQRASRQAWRMVGRRWGPLAYWAILSPLTTAQWGTAQCFRLRSLVVRALKRAGKPLARKSHEI